MAEIIIAKFLENDLDNCTCFHVRDVTLEEEGAVILAPHFVVVFFLLVIIIYFVRKIIIIIEHWCLLTALNEKMVKYNQYMHTWYSLFATHDWSRLFVDKDG